MSSKEELREEVYALKTELDQIYRETKAKADAEHKPITEKSFYDNTYSGKYASGPVYVPLGPGAPTYGEAFSGIQASDFPFVLGSTAMFYVIGALSSKKLGFKTHNSLGVATAIPGFLLGLCNAYKNSVFRYTGILDNGNPTVVPGFKDSAAARVFTHERNVRWIDPEAVKSLQ